MSGCISGLSKVSMTDGYLVSFEELDSYDGDGGSLSTVWYLGSDEKYHYFNHLAKISTKYKVYKEELMVPVEFPVGSQRSVYVLFEELDGVRQAVSGAPIGGPLRYAPLDLE
ncbi:MAG: hypothetical protein ACPGN3_02910 [Opitutales bacterium]